MIDRKKTIKKNVMLSVLFTILIMLIFVVLGGYGVFVTMFPQNVSRDNLTEDDKYTFVAVKAGNLAEDEEEGILFMSLINKENEVIDVTIKTREVADELMTASPDRPVKFKGIIAKYEESEEESKEYFEYIKNEVFSETEYVYGWFLIEAPKEKTDYLAFIFIAIIIIVNSYHIYSSVSKMAKANVFYNDNTLYNELEPSMKFHKNVEIVKNYLLITHKLPEVIDINTNKDFYITRYRRYFITVYFGLTFVDENGKRKNIQMPKLTKEKTNEFISYLMSIGRYKI